MQEWFSQAKLGIFIHWGIYAVEGISESWSFGRGRYTYNQYMRQAEGFTAKRYDPSKWAQLFQKAGARYAVLTSKHHDGFALFDTQHTTLNAVKGAPSQRDLIAPYCQAMREAGLKVGIYFTNTDWSDIDHLCVLLDKTPQQVKELQDQHIDYPDMWKAYQKEIRDKNIPPFPEKQEAWERFMTRYKGEIKELLTNYGEVDLLWFDVMVEMMGYSWESKQVREMIKAISPKTIVNGRLGKYGDYETPEMYIPLTPLNGPWELCTTFNNSWGFRFDDHNYKDIRQIVRMFCECISKGGNMLISCGPNAEGEIPEEVAQRMLELGAWIAPYEEAIYPTKAGIPPQYFLGGSTLGQDEKTLYLFLYDKPHKHIMLNGIRSKIKRVTEMKSGAELNHKVIGGAGWINMPGSIWIEVPPDMDDICSVIKIEWEDKIDLVELGHVGNSKGEE